MPLPDKILRESSKSVSFKTIKASYGDGYSQRAPDGLNYRKESWEVKWAALTKEEMLAVTTDLDSVGGHGVIIWVPCDDVVSKKFINSDSKYSVTRAGAMYSISISLEQVFDV